MSSGMRSRFMQCWCNIKPNYGSSHMRADTADWRPLRMGCCHAVIQTIQSMVIRMQHSRRSSEDMQQTFVQQDFKDLFQRELFPSEKCWLTNFWFPGCLGILCNVMSKSCHMFAKAEQRACADTTGCSGCARDFQLATKWMQADHLVMVTRRLKSVK